MTRRGVHRRLKRMVCTLVVISLLLWVFGAATADDAGNQTEKTMKNDTAKENIINGSAHVFEYKVQEDPFFTFSFPAGMNNQITSLEGRNTYLLTSMKEPEMEFFITSEPNNEETKLNESTIKEFEKKTQSEAISGMMTDNLTGGVSKFFDGSNQSSFFSSYLDNDAKKILYLFIVSNDQSVISGVLTEPTTMYNTDFGNFTMKSLLSITPRTVEEGFTLKQVGTDKELGLKGNSTAGKPKDRGISYDPNSGLYYDTDTGYYYLAQFGVFYDPETGNYYYPEEFGNYGTDNFVDYTGVYDPSVNDQYSYDNLYSGYSGAGNDATDIIMDTYNNRQEVMDASNAMWDDYIRGDTYYSVDDYGTANPIDTTQEYIDSGLT